MDLTSLYVSQRQLRSPAQLCALIAAIRDGDPIPPSEDDDGSFQIEDGHHRATAYVLAGRDLLEPHEYIVIPRERRRPRFGGIADLLNRVRKQFADKREACASKSIV